MTDTTPPAVIPHPQAEASSVADRLKTFIRRVDDEPVRDAIERAVTATLRGPEARGVVVTAPSGAGKTTLLTRVIAKHPEIGEEAGHPCRIMRVQVGSPCTLKDLGRTVAAKAGYPIQGAGLDAPVIWRRARSEIRKAEIRLILFDEIQNITDPAKKGDDQHLRDTLKTLLIDADWPVGLILVGQPSVVSFLAADAQVRRRMDFVQVQPIAPKEIKVLLKAVVELTARAGIASEVEDAEDVMLRLVHAADGQFGTAIEIMRNAIVIAARDKPGTALAKDHFAREYALRTGNAAFANPFVATDYLAVDPRRCNVTKPEQVVQDPSPPSKRRPGRGRSA